MKIEDIRNIEAHIKEGEIDMAFSILSEEYKEGKYINILIHLLSQYNRYQKEYHLNLSPPKEELNKIIYSTLNYLLPKIQNERIGQISKETKNSNTNSVQNLDSQDRINIAICSNFGVGYDIELSKEEELLISIEYYHFQQPDYIESLITLLKNETVRSEIKNEVKEILLGQKELLREYNYANNIENFDGVILLLNMQFALTEKTKTLYNLLTKLTSKVKVYCISNNDCRDDWMYWLKGMDITFTIYNKRQLKALLYNYFINTSGFFHKRTVLHNLKIILQNA